MGIRDIFRGLARNDNFKAVPQIESKMDAAVPSRIEIDSRFKTDDWVNPVTGLGTSGDKKTWGTLYDTVLSVFELDTAYQSSILASSICDIPAYEKLRQGFQIKLPDEDNDSGMLDAFKTELQAHELTQKFTMGDVFSNLYGGGGIYVGVDDGLNPWDPLDLSKIRKVEYLTLLDRYELVNSGMIDMSVTSANFARPYYYTLATIDPNYAGVNIHHSRIIRFDGIQMSRRRMSFFFYWGQSLINRTINIIRGYETGLGSISTMIQDYNILLIEMKNLPQILAGGATERKWFQKKIAATVEMLSTLHAFVLSEGEKASHLTRNVTGLPELVDRLVGQVVMAAKIPRVLLFGEAAATGLNANSDGEVRMFYDYIRSQQINALQPKLRKLIQIFMASKSGAFAGNVVPFQIEFNPLWQMNEKEQAEIHNQVAQADNANIMNGVYSAEEARSRYKNGKFNLNICLDEELEAKVTAANKQTRAGGIDDPNLPDDEQDGPYAWSMRNAASVSETFPSRKV